MGDGEFIRCEMEILKEKKQFDQLFNLCYAKLDRLILAKKAKEHISVIDSLSGADDWFMWDALLVSAKGSTTPE
jgi:hypothetical protein